MFTGIVQGLAKVADIRGSEEMKSLRIDFPDGALKDLERGASIAINGVCLTVTEFDIGDSWASFDVMFETLDKTNIGMLKSSNRVNYERAARIGDEIGGHMMSGHISTCVEVSHISAQDTKYSIYFKTPKPYKDFLLPKGFVGLNGCSLTLDEHVGETFAVHLIPETLNATNFSQLQAGDLVNLEVDPQTQAIVETVKKYMATAQA